MHQIVVNFEVGVFERIRELRMGLVKLGATSYCSKIVVNVGRKWTERSELEREAKKAKRRTGKGSRSFFKPTKKSQNAPKSNPRGAAKSLRCLSS